MVEYRSTARRDRYGSQINRAHSPLIALVVPWASIVLGSLMPLFPLISSMPLLPPMGFMLFIAWRLVRPGLLPVWAGLPLGLVDDLFSGQPLGSAILLWSLILLALDQFEARFPWGGFAQEWLLATVVTVAYILASAFIAGTGVRDMLSLLAPQLLLSVLLFPIFGRMVAFLDRFRLRRFRTVG
ncbi:MAG: rod shape-determining protein MreD [Novosphingobium sp.]|nr:rod shape-determining protein MreD [Novosphingobium sp.]